MGLITPKCTCSQVTDVIEILFVKVTLVDGRTLLKWLEVANGSSAVKIGDEAGSLAELLVEQVTYIYLFQWFLAQPTCLMFLTIDCCKFMCSMFSDLDSYFLRFCPRSHVFLT